MTTIATPKPVTKRNIRNDYAAGVASLRPFYKHSLQDIDFVAIREAKHYADHHRSTLVEVLQAQYAALPSIPAVNNSLELLASPDTFSLTTGHQLNIMGGPMYTPYKVLTVAKLAHQLTEQDPNNPVVPVFWIHTEDHDFEEINHYFSDFGKKETYKAPFASATGIHELTEEVSSLIPEHFAQELKDAYATGNSLAEATLRFAHHVYGPYGVLVLDASDPALKALFKPVLEKELFSQFSETAVLEQNSALNELGYPQQVHPREINLFWLDEKGRDRILKRGDDFGIDGRETIISKAEMEALVQNQPERFSPNVILRPLYQEYILPNLAYTGGWGELAYWMQLKGVFEATDTPFPLLLPRFSATMFTQKQQADWEALGFSLADIKTEEHMLFRQYMPNVWDDEQYKALTESVQEAFDALGEYIGTESKTLPRSVIGQQVKTTRFFKNMEKKLHRLKRDQNREPFQKIHTLKRAINPDGAVQERTLGLASFPAFSVEKIINQIYKELEPLSFKHSFISLED
ncbi:MAG: bacillithiol biosynthesis cysteine-adding enzyme BshC [Bacteroidia bacterium]